MKFSAYVCILFYLVVSGSAFPRPGRPHPLWATQQAYQPQNDFLTMALLMGLDFNELLTLRAVSGQGINNLGMGNLSQLGQLLGAGGFGAGLRPRAQQRARQDLNTLSLLGILDGPDLPDGPAGGGRRAGRRGGPPKVAAPAAAAGGEGGAGGEAAEGAPPAKKPAAAKAAKPKRRGPRRQGPQRG